MRRAITRDLIQGLLALVVLVPVAAGVLLERELPASYITLTGIVVGFYFGRVTNGVGNGPS